MADEQPVDERPLAERAIEPTDFLGRPIKYVSDEERRAAEVALEDPAKYAVQAATPSSGGVFPPSAIVTPFSAEEVAAHTPGDEGREKAAKKAAEAIPAEQSPPAEQAPPA
jgi:hypothetical protein